MDLLPFGTLQPYRARRFLPEQLDLGDWTQVAPWFDRLETQAQQLRTGPALEQWLLDWSELSAAMEEESTRRYIAMTCHTDNPAAQEAYLHFLENIEPQLKPRQFKLEQLYVAHPARKQLPPQRYEVFTRDTEVRAELFRPENVPLETQEAKLSQEYQKLTGSLTVQFQGQERTLVQMGRYLEEPDRALRQQTWELVANRRLQEEEKFEDIFQQLFKLRQQIASNAGFANYREYAFRRLGRFDYTPEDCKRFHEAVEAEVLPLLDQLHTERRESLKLDALRPWDLAVDPSGRAPLRPFEHVDQMVSRTNAIFERLDPELAQGFGQMCQLRLLDLENHKGKAPGGYQSTLAEARLPFIFMNAVGVQRDVETILHEAGHAFHALATRDEDLYAYRGAPIEFCEVASMSMELLGNQFLEQFYSPVDARRARRTHLEGVLAVLPWIATVDAFQQLLYTNPNHSRAERKATWVELMARFGGQVDWGGYEPARACLWHRQLHIFTHPFYYIEYGIAQLGALRVWANARKDKSAGLKAYKNALKLGGSRPLPELFAAAGCRFDFSRQSIGPLMKLVADELARLPLNG